MDSWIQKFIFIEKIKKNIIDASNYIVIFLIKFYFRKQTISLKDYKSYHSQEILYSKRYLCHINTIFFGLFINNCCNYYNFGTFSEKLAKNSYFLFKFYKINGFV